MSVSEFASPSAAGATSLGLQRRAAMLLPIAIVATIAFCWMTRPASTEAFVVLAAFSVPALWVVLRLSPAEPAVIRRTTFATSLLPILLAPTGFLLLGAEGWTGVRPLVSLAIVTILSAGATSQACHRWARRAGSSTPLAADEMPRQPSVVAGAVAIAFPAIACALLALDFGAWADARRDDASRTRFVSNLVEALAQVDSEGSLGERLESILPRSAGQTEDLQGFSISSDGRIEAGSQRSGATLSSALLDAVDAGRDAGESSGTLEPRGGRHVGAYRILDDGTALVIRIDRAEMSGPFAASAQAWGFLALLLAVVVWHARTLEQDRMDAVERVRVAATNLAGGRLEALPEPDGGSELADIEIDLTRAAKAFSGLVDRASEATDEVALALETVAARVEEIERSGADRSAQIAEARRHIARIHAEVGNASQTTGELDQALDESANSVLELGAAGDELNETASILTSKVDEVSGSLEQMVRSVKEVSSTTDRLAEASEETSSSMEEMASAMRAVDTAAEMTANLSNDVVEKAELGQAKVVQTIAGMEAIREATDAAESVIRGLGNRTHEIGGILDVIDDVADETNLLALNAAIIAAQAGEQGKAFSVVADEIKELADRVLASTKEIGGLIRAVQEESENAIGAIEAGSSSVMSGVDLSAEAGKTLEEITDASRESGTRIREIVNSVREQTKAASHVVNLMERVRESADQIGAASAQQDQGNEIVYRSALTMREVAQQVRRTTEDQATGFGRIKQNVVGVRGAVELISRALTKQDTACGEVGRCLDAVGTGDQANAAAAEALRETLDALGARATALRQDIDGFRA